MLKILDRYVIKELLIPFFLGIFILTFLILVQQLLRLMELIIDKGVDLLSVAEIFIYLLPSFFLVTIPMAVMLASIMTFNRLSSDNEIIALKSAGVGFYRLIRPAVIFAVIASLLTLFMGAMAQPWSGGSFKSLSLRMLKERAGIGLEEGKFNGTFSDMIFYVESMPSFTELQGVFIYDLRDPELPVTIVAKKGLLTNNAADQTIELRLMEGQLHRKSKNIENYQRMTFANYDLKFDFSAFEQGSGDSAETPTYSDIKKRIEASHGEDAKALRLLSDFYKNFSFSLASFLFAIIGVPLGIISGRMGKLGGFAVGIGIITLYYLLNTLGDYLISRRMVPPLISAGLPHIVLIPFCIYLLIISSNEKFPKFLNFANKRP
jgi:lipopolysaccharide export system permease protein